MNQACCDFCGASKSSRSTGSSWTISSIRPLRTSPLPRKMPAVPDSRASVMTFQAPARELLADPLDPLVGREDRLGVLGADLREHAEVLRERLDDLELALAREVDRAVRDLDALEAVLAQPAAVAVELATHLGDLEQRAAADTGMPSER